MNEIALANDLVFRSLLAKLERLERRVADLESKRPKTKAHKAQRDRGDADYVPFERMSQVCFPIVYPWGLTVDDVRGRKRDKHILKVRRMTMAACLDEGFSAALVGRFFDWRDHSTILQLVGRRS